MNSLQCNLPRGKPYRNTTNAHSNLGEGLGGRGMDAEKHVATRVVSFQEQERLRIFSGCQSSGRN